VILRDYQTQLIDGARERIRRRKRALVVAPTGAGKTVLAAFMQGGAARRGQSSWFIVHRREILERTAETFAEVGIDFGMVLDGYPMRPEAPVQLCGVQSLVGRLDDLPRPAGVVWDEAHHRVAGDHAAVGDHVADAWQVGVTATPERLDGEGLGDCFDELVLGPTTGGLMGRGFLSPYRLFAPGRPDMLGTTLTSMAEAMGDARLIGDAVEHWHRDARGMQTIGFEMNRAASQATVAAFRSEGVEAHHVDGTMHRDKRKELFRAFRAREITYLSQVAIAGEGVDIPGAECALLRYKTNSLTKFLQDVGRVFRPIYEPGFDAGAATDAERVASIAAGPKPFAVILDMGGNAFDFGMPCDERRWSLLGAKERRVMERMEDGFPIHTCPECYQITASAVRVCPCGYEFTVKERSAAWAEGQLFELKASREEAKAAAEAEKQAKRKREKDEERGASLGRLMQLAFDRNRDEPGRYADPRRWAANKIRIREDMKRGGRARFGAR
jgi:superfamily II DNA or RNA helicase